MSKLYGKYSDIEPYAATGYADQVRRPATVDHEGRKNPNMRYQPGYVMTTERVVEHVTRAPIISIVRPADRPYWSNYGADDNDQPEMDNYGYPQPNYSHPMENFFTKVQTEISKPQPATKLPGPFTSNWRAQPNNHSTARQEAEDYHQVPKKIQSVPIGNPSPGANKYNHSTARQEAEEHHQIPKKIQSVPNKYNFYERPNEGPVLPARPLSRPTTDINEAVEMLTGGIGALNRPAMGGAPRSKPGGDDMKEQKGYDRMDQSHSPQKMHHQEKRFGVAPKEVISYSSGSDSDSVDGGEARKQYGKLKPQPVPLPEKAYKGPINSDDLIRKYNGAKVPW